MRSAATMPKNPATDTGSSVAAADPAPDTKLVSGPIRRFTAAMIDPWLIDRIEKVWPSRTEQYWRNLLAGFMASNDYLFICNDRAVLLAERKPQPMAARPMVWVIFCWSRDTKPGEWLSDKLCQPVIELYNYTRRWMTEMDGERMLCALCDDIRGDRTVRLWLEWRAVQGAPVVSALPYAAKRSA